MINPTNHAAQCQAATEAYHAERGSKPESHSGESFYTADFYVRAALEASHEAGYVLALYADHPNYAAKLQGEHLGNMVAALNDLDTLMGARLSE